MNIECWTGADIHLPPPPRLKLQRQHRHILLEGRDFQVKMRHQTKLMQFHFL